MSFADLKGRTAVVTGAARGIGFAIADNLARGGADIVVIDLAQEASDAAAARLAQHGIKAIGVAANVASADGVKKACEESLKLNGKVDILVNNAGITRDNLLIRMKDEEWDAVLTVNLKSVFLMCREFIRPMMKARYGRIVNIASVVGLIGNPGQSNYAAAKAGMIGLTKTLAREFASRSITVNAVAPGYINTEMIATVSKDVLDKMLALVPLERLGEPEDVARVVRFLASDEAAYLTGQVISVAGGMTM